MQQLQAIARNKQSELNNKYQQVQHITMKTDITGDLAHFIHKLHNEHNVVVGPDLRVPLKFMLDPELLQGEANTFFTNLGCLNADRTINMLQVNKIKQSLDTVKDGTAMALLKKLKIWDFGRIWEHIRYPETLNSLKEYFFEHFKKQGMCNTVFWPRHGNFPGYVSPELGMVDCGFDPELVHVKSMTAELDPLSHGSIKNIDVIFPRVGITITWDSSTLEALGYPPNCQITAKCTSAHVGQHSDWDISVTCANSSGQRILMDSTGIFKLGPTGAKTDKIETKLIKTFEDTIKGNAFKGLTQKGEKETPNTLLIFMGLVFNKSFGDNGFGLVQRALAILGVPVTIFTCDSVLFDTIMTSMTESGGVFTTNHREEPGLPTGNLSTRFRATELLPLQELQSIFDSCLFENNAYLQTLKNLYNDALTRSPQSIRIKLGGATHEVNLWFLVTIIDTIEEMIRNHRAIMDVFIELQMVTTSPITQEWRTHKQYILQLLKSYCKIVFPFVKKNGEWNVFCQSSLISKFPASRQGEHAQISTLMRSCEVHNTANKEALTRKMNDILRRNTKPISVVKLNMQQYALIVKNKFDIADNTSLPAQRGGGRNKRRDNIKIGGMKKSHSPDQSPPPTGSKRTDYSPPPLGAVVPAVVPTEQKKNRPPLLPQEEEDVEINTRAKTLFNIDSFKFDMKTIIIPECSPRSPESNSEMEFSPKAFCENETVNREIFLLIQLSDFLSHMLKLVSYIITSGIIVTNAAAGGGAAAAEPEAGQELVLQYGKCVTAMQYYQRIYGREPPNILWGLAAFLDHSLATMMSKVPPSDVLGHLYSNIKEGYDLVIEKLENAGINPSSDTIEFAITSFNLYIREHLHNPGQNFANEYNQSQRGDLQGIPGADEDVMNSLSLTDDSLYENIKNIAYNLFLNHEYELPLICTTPLFRQYFAELIGESKFNITLHVAGYSLGIVAPADIPEAVVNPGAEAAGRGGDPITAAQANQQYDGYNGEPNPFLLLTQSSEGSPARSSQSGDDYGNDSGDSAPTVISPSRTGGSSARSRRKLRRNHRRTQYTNKHKRSSKHATIKHRKSYRKHHRTIKRRNNSRRRNQ